MNKNCDKKHEQKLIKLLEIFLYNAVGYEQAFHQLFKFPHYVEMGINVSTGYQVER